MMEVEFSPADEPKKATEKHVKELNDKNDKIDKLTNQVSGLEQQLSTVLKILDTVALDVRATRRMVRH